MKLIDQYHKDGVFDAYTFVFDEVSPEGYHTMLALSEDGNAFSQWTNDLYDPDEDNAHLGTRVVLHELGATILNAFFSRLSIPREWEAIHRTIEAVVRDTEHDE